MGFHHTREIIDRLQPKVVVPHHYYIWNVVQRQSTLQPAAPWVATQPRAETLDSPSFVLDASTLAAENTRVVHFGDHVAFDAEAWRTGANAE